MKKFYPFLLVLAVPVVLLLQSNNNGSAGGKTGSPGDNGTTCAQCHTGTAQTAANWITSNIPFTGYVPGETYTITATSTHSGAAKIGFELTVENAQGVKTGQLALLEPSRTKLINSNKAVTHTSAGNVPNGNTNSWTMSWTAPALGAGTVGFYSSFNAANGNGTTSGDVIYTSSTFASQAAPAAISSIQPDEAFRGESILATIKGQNSNWSTGTVNNVLLENNSNPFETIVASSFSVTNSTTIAADFNIPVSASTGLWNVKVDDLILANSFTVLLPTSIGDNEILASLSIYPVPAGKTLNVEGAKGASMAIFNISGSNVIDIEQLTDKQLIDVSSLPNGLYIMRLFKDGQSRTEKLMISK